MKKIKIVIVLIVFGFIGVIIYQNQNYFFATHALKMNLLVGRYETIEIHNVIFFAGCFVFGFFLAYFFTLRVRFRAKKKIEDLYCTIDSHLETISNLKGQLEALTGKTPEMTPPVQEQKEQPIQNPE
ncbi:MAG: hypothetical protein HQK77_08590 [Desulfobacterales bacterium]|nr:hypothetical protein [Desulfobacterales bacterium]